MEVEVSESEEAPKSAYELAMERLRKKDAEAGVEQQHLTDEQRGEIAEVRSLYEARLAEREILHASQRSKAAADAAALEVLEEEYRRDRDRLLRERESKIEKIREKA
jgi:hypothetical protein